MKSNLSTLAIILVCAITPFLLISQTVTVTTTIYWAEFATENSLPSGTKIPAGMTINIESGGELIVGDPSSDHDLTIADCFGVINVNAGGILRVEGDLSIEKEDMNQVSTPTINVMGILNNQEGSMNVRKGSLLYIAPSGTYNAFGTTGLPSSGSDGFLGVDTEGIFNIEGTGVLQGGSISVGGELNLINNSAGNRTDKSMNSASLTFGGNATLNLSFQAKLIADILTTIEFKDNTIFYIFSLAIISGTLILSNAALLYVENIGELILANGLLTIPLGVEMELWGPMNIHKN